MGIGYQLGMAVIFCFLGMFFVARYVQNIILKRWLIRGLLAAIVIIVIVFIVNDYPADNLLCHGGYRRACPPNSPIEAAFAIVSLIVVFVLAGLIGTWWVKRKNPKKR